MRFDAMTPAVTLAALLAAAPTIAQTTRPQAAPAPTSAAGAALAPVDPVAPAAAAPARAATPPAGDTAPAYGPQKAVYHVSGDGGENGKSYDGVLSNLRNHLDAVGENAAELRVVMNGDGIGLLQKAAADQAMQGKIVELKNRRGRFLVCNDTLTCRKIEPNSLFDDQPEDMVPAGVAEVARLQSEGFASIKP